MNSPFPYITVALFVFIFVGATSLLSGCHSHHADPSMNSTDSMLLALEGKWKWIERTDAYAINGLPYDTAKASDLDLVEYLFMNSDHTWYLQANGLVINEGSYRIDTLSAPGGPIRFLDMVHVGHDSLVSHWIDGDTLFTSKIGRAHV